MLVQPQRLWGSVPVAICNLLDEGLVYGSFNQALTKAAVLAFDEYIALHKSGEPPEPVLSTSKERRRLRRLASRQEKRQQHSPLANHIMSMDHNENGLTDQLFEHDRLQGYHLARESLRMCPAVTRLQQELIPQAVADYLLLLSSDEGSQAWVVAQGLLTNGFDYNVDLWAAVQREAGHEPRVHRGACVSGIYYAAVPDGSAPLVFQRPPELARQEQNQKDVALSPREGQLVIFPSWLVHGVPRSTTTTEPPRVSFAFNVKSAFVRSPWGVIPRET